MTPKHTAFAFALILVISACTGARALYNLPETPSQYAKAILLHHNALGEQVVDLRQDSTVSDASKQRLLDAYRVTVCGAEERKAERPTAECAEGPAQQLEKAAAAYDAVKSAKTEAELQAAMNTIVSLLTPLITAVNGAR